MQYGQEPLESHGVGSTDKSVSLSWVLSGYRQSERLISPSGLARAEMGALITLKNKNIVALD